MTTATRDAVILGAGGYVGGELLRLVLTHPNLRLRAALSDSQAGKPIGEVHPQLAPLTELEFQAAADWSPETLRRGSWTVLAALDHGASMARLPGLLEQTAGCDLQLVDMSGDFRLRDPAVYERFYGRAHTAVDRLGEFAYGLPELNRGAIAAATRIANPGCFATAVTLAVAPAAAAGWQVRGMAADGMTGSSGAGVGPRPTTHHPRRSNNLQAYKPLGHQHLPEIVQSWVDAGGDPAVEISFVPHMAPLVRGIAVTAHLLLDRPVAEAEARARYRSFYGDAPFVRVVSSPSGVVDVWGSNRCDLSVTARGSVVAVCTVIDNLVKGAAGQAIQNVNLMNGWPETSGLLTPMPAPV